MAVPKIKNRVLIVDDEPDIRNIVAAHIGFLGYEAVEAENGRVALNHLQNTDFDVIISDLAMPELTGMQLLAKLIEYNSFIPFVFLSGHTNANLTLEALNLGAFDYLEKPFDAGDFRLLIREAMRVSKERQKIDGRCGRIVIPNGKETAYSEEKDAKKAALEIEKISSLKSLGRDSRKPQLMAADMTKADQLRYKFAEESVLQLTYLENALVSLGQGDSCAWELGYGFRVMREISSAARALKEPQVSSLTAAFEQAFSFFRVRESMLTTSRMIEIREANKILKLFLETLMQSLNSEGGDLSRADLQKIEKELMVKFKTIINSLRVMTIDNAV